MKYIKLLKPIKLDPHQKSEAKRILDDPYLSKLLKEDNFDKVFDFISKTGKPFTGALQVLVKVLLACDIEFLDKLQHIYEDLFRNTDVIEKVIIPNNITSIDQSAFTFCEGLTSISIPDSINSIGKWAFDGCKSLTSVIIPDTITTIEQYAFSYCKNLTTLVYQGLKAEWEKIKKGYGWREASGIETIHCKDRDIKV